MTLRKALERNVSGARMGALRGQADGLRHAWGWGSKPLAHGLEARVGDGFIVQIHVWLMDTPEL